MYLNPCDPTGKPVSMAKFDIHNGDTVWWLHKGIPVSGQVITFDNWMVCLLLTQEDDVNFVERLFVYESLESLTKAIVGQQQMTLTPQMIDACFEGETDQGNVIINLYKMAYGTDIFDKARFIPHATVGKAIQLYIFEKFIAFDKLHHPQVLNGGAWLNYGFSSDDSLGPWCCVLGKIEAEENK